MKGAAIAYNPCYKCTNKIMCEMCELKLHRDGVTIQKRIPVTERLPGDEQDRVLVATDCDSPVGNQKIDTDRYVDGRWVRYVDHVTHRMPFPEPPSESTVTVEDECNNEDWGA